MTYLQLLSGLRPEVIDSATLRILPGQCGSADGSSVVALPSYQSISITANGPWGLDTGSPVSSQDYFPYVIRQQSDGTVSVMLSASITYGGVVVPPGWEMIRKLPFGLVYPFRDMHVSGWPQPTIVYTADVPASLAGGQSVPWSLVSLASLIPDNARLAHLTCVIDHDGGGIGQAFVSPIGGTQTGIRIGRVSTTVPYHADVPVIVRVTSERKLNWKTTGGAKLSLYVRGYSMTEPS